jgi:hypothetical protein
MPLLTFHQVSAACPYFLCLEFLANEHAERLWIKSRRLGSDQEKIAFIGIENNDRDSVLYMVSVKNSHKKSPELSRHFFDYGESLIT